MADDPNTVGGDTAVFNLLGSDGAEYEHTLLDKVEAFIKQGEFGIAVILTMTACEIAAGLAISRGFASKRVDANLARSVVAFYQYSSTNLNSPEIGNLYNALTGRNIQEEASFWEPFKDSVKVRNDAVHKGATPTAEQAKTAHSAAIELIAI